MFPKIHNLNKVQEAMRPEKKLIETIQIKDIFCKSLLVWLSSTIAFAQGKNIPSAKMPKIGPPVIPNRAIAA